MTVRPRMHTKQHSRARWRSVSLCLAFLVVPQGRAWRVASQTRADQDSASDSGQAGLRTSDTRSIASRSIRPGFSVGPLKLGDTQEQAFRALHASQGQVYDFLTSGCGGTWFSWGDIHKSKSLGNVYFYLRDDAVFQVDSATTGFRTVEGVTARSSPEQVRRYYKGLRAYILSEFTSEALGNRPLIYWTDRAKGIAFAFAYYPKEQKRYLYAIIVFKPNTDLCPFGGTSDSHEVRELAPYSLEAPSPSDIGSSSPR